MPFTMRRADAHIRWCRTCNLRVNSDMLAGMSAPTVVFLSDVHLGMSPRDEEAEREARLLAFLRSLPGRASHLYVVGDLFEFWFEYTTAIPRRYFELLRALADLRDAGVHVTLMAGNHDFWLGPFLSGELGLSTTDGPLTVEHQGRRVWLHHGDGIVAGDLGYKVLRRVLRHPLSIGLYRWLHPDVGIPLAHWASHTSRRSRVQLPLPADRLYERLAVPRFREGYDAVMIGHYHRAYQRRDGRHVFFVLGDWFRTFSWVELADGEFTLHRLDGVVATT
jgi:UDP-2,3-diacylglucosamine hydrolase